MANNDLHYLYFPQIDVRQKLLEHKRKVILIGISKNKYQ